MMKLVVLSCVLAAASASGLLAYSAPLAYGAPLAYASPLLQPWNYRGPLSLAPGQPANIIAADGRPLDTLEVNLDRSAHYTAKALEGSGIHLLKKRSVLAAPLISPLAYAAPLTYAAPLYQPFNYRGPLSLAPGQPANIIAADGRPLDTLDVNLDRSAHFTAKALEGSGLHLLKKRSAVLAAPLIAPVVHAAPLAYSTHLAPAIAPIAPISHFGIAPISYASAYAHRLF